jgi:hypothetical protein
MTIEIERSEKSEYELLRKLQKEADDLASERSFLKLENRLLREKATMLTKLLSGSSSAKKA